MCSMHGFIQNYLYKFLIILHSLFVLFRHLHPCLWYAMERGCYAAAGNGMT